MAVGVAAFSVFGTDVVEAFRETENFEDFVEDAELPGVICILLASIGGAESSTSQLHYLAIRDITT